MLSVFKGNSDAPRVERTRHEARLRNLVVESVEKITPSMLRIGFSGQDLADFVSLGFDDHVKIFVPTEAGAEERRDYTPRRYDAAAQTLVLDFAVHEAGPATQWALDARPGDTLKIGGPKGSSVIRSDIGRWVLIGDETALPAIGRRIEEAVAGEHIISITAVTGPAEEQAFRSSAEVRSLWVHRPLSAAADPGALLDVVRTVDIHLDAFVWVAAEAVVARAIRDHIVEERGYPRSWVKAGGYWIKGRADAHERIA